MYYELYIDILFFVNFMMDSILLLAIKTILKLPGKLGRIFLGGMTGSFCTCFIMVLPIAEIVKLILFHSFVQIVMLFIALEIHNRAEFFRALILLYILSISLGGILQLFRPYIRQGSIYFVIAVLSYYAIYGSWRFLSKLQKYESKYCEITLYIEGKKYKVRALFGTGNILVDEATQKMVCILDQEYAKHIFSENEQGKFRKIPYRTVGACGELSVCDIEKMCIHMAKNRWVLKPVIGISQVKISSQKEYQMIVNPEILGGREDECKNNITTKD